MESFAILHLVYSQINVISDNNQKLHTFTCIFIKQNNS